MIDAGLRALHVPWWVPFLVWFGLYGAAAFWYVCNGYAEEYLGWRHPGRPGKIHTVLVRFHTGAHVHPERSYGDERWRSKIARTSSTAHYNPHSRMFRAVRNNAIVFTVLLVLSCMVSFPADTVRAVTLLVLALLVLWCVQGIRKARATAARRRPVSRPAFARTNRAKAVLAADATTIGSRPKLAIEAEPVLEGVSAGMLATLLSREMDCSSAEIVARLRLEPEQGTLELPDSFNAIERKRELIQEVISAHFKGKLAFTWRTTETPRVLVWTPVITHTLPSMVRMSDYLPQIEALPAREFGLGVVANRSMYVQSHAGDAPMWCDFMGSGCGKSTKFAVKAAQIAHRDPAADIYCIDTKQVSFDPLHGIPGIHIYDNPVTGMREIWEVFYELAGILESRYEAVRLKRARLSDFNDIWVLCDEGNHLGGKLKNYHTKVLGETSASPAVWADAIAPLLQQGRQGSIFCEFMFQDLTDRAMGGQSLKFAFGGYIAAGFLPNQFTRTIGSPAEECQEGQGRMLVCVGKNRTWTQGFYEDEQWLYDYAIENRKGRAA